jgi:hypothetical protein
MDAQISNTHRTARVHIRSQHSNGSSAHRFGGPDTYVAVTLAPAGVEVPYNLRRDVLRRRGIQIRYFGEGYSKHTGSRSMLGQAMAEARRFAEQVNAGAGL